MNNIVAKDLSKNCQHMKIKLIKNIVSELFSKILLFNFNTEFIIYQVDR